MKSISGVNSCNTRRRINSQQIKQRFTIKTFNFTHENNEIHNINKNTKPNECKGGFKILTERNSKNQIQVSKYFRYANFIYFYINSFDYYNISLMNVEMQHQEWIEEKKSEATNIMNQKHNILTLKDYCCV